MAPWVVGAVVAGVAGAPHCLGMCGPLACLGGARARDQLAYHVGRVATYAALGAVSGGLGRVVPGPAWVGPAVAAVLVVGFAAVLAGLLPEPRFALPGLAKLGSAAARRADLPSRFALGVVNGFLPCGLVYATLGLAVAAAHPLTGALVMGVFGLATMPALGAAALGLRRVVAGSLAARRVLAGVVLVTGLGTLALRAGAFAAGDSGDAPPCHSGASTSP